MGNPERSAQGWFPAAPASVPAARRFVGALLAGWQDDDRVAEVLLCVSELTTNALVHVGGDGFEVRALVWPERVRVEIGDGCSRGITLGGGDAGGTPGAATAGGSPGDVAADRAAGARSHGGDDLGGRGLVLVGALADDWGVRVERVSGKAVWAEFTGATGATEVGGGPP